jgi:glycosyltransferase involved in cell wall biosynthesis
MRHESPSPAVLEPYAADVVAGRVDQVIVAVPARNEAESIVACLASIDNAAERVGPTPVTVVVGADSCTDGTARIAESYRAQHVALAVVEGGWSSASGARRAAVEAGRRSMCRGSAPVASTVWIANTDADCVVPRDWLATHLDLAARGCPAVGGIVTLDPDLTPAEVLRDFGRSYVTSGERHVHLHAANLGLRLDVYDAVDGWHAGVELGEEHELAHRLATVGVDVLRTTASSVVTSHRHIGRAADGFAAFLRLLGAQRGRDGEPLVAGPPTIRFVA